MATRLLRQLIFFNPCCILISIYYLACCQSLENTPPQPAAAQPALALVPKRKPRPKHKLKKLTVTVTSNDGRKCESSCEKLCLPECDFVCCIPMRLRNKKFAPKAIGKSVFLPLEFFF